MLAGGTARLTSLSATSPPKRTVTLRASMTGMSPAPSVAPRLGGLGGAHDCVTSAVGSAGSRGGRFDRRRRSRGS